MYSKQSYAESKSYLGCIFHPMITVLFFLTSFKWGSQCGFMSGYTSFFVGRVAKSV